MLKLSSNLKIFVVRYFHTLKKHKVPVTRQLHNFAHQKLLGKYLLLTNTISSGLLMAAGDCIQQQIEFYKGQHKKGTYDWRRTTNMSIVGFVLGPVQHFFYKYIDYILPKRTLKSVLKKILLDQTIASPTSICIFFYGLGLLENGNVKEAHEELKKKFLTIYMMDWMVWPPSQFINFAYLPAKYRVVYVNLITMLYNVFLSYVKHVRTAWTASREEKKNKNKKFLLSTWRLLQRHFAYCCRTTSLHGFRYLVDPKCSKRERFMWACVVVAGVWATIYSLNSQVQLYYNNPIFYSSLATRKMIRDVPFPGITICSNNQIPPSAFNYSATVLKPRDQLTEQERFQLDFANYFCKFEDDTEYFYEHLNVSVIENIFQKKNNFCAEEFLEMVWKQRRLIEPCDFLQEVLTWYGHCYAFNMVSFHQFYQPDYVTWYLSPSAPTNTSSASMGGETKAFYKSDEVKSTDPGQRDIHSEDELPSTPWFTNDSSLLGGIMVTLNLRSHDFDNICSLGDKSFTVIVHPPDEVADWSHDSYTIQDNSITLIKLLPEVVEHSPMLETLPPAHRRCYVEGERELRFYKVYNQRNCETECHANLSLQHCGCVAYFHPRDKGTPVCNQAKSECLIQVQQAISERCNCLERCSGTRYNTEYFFINKKKRIHPDLDLTLLVVQFPRKRVMTKVADTIAGKIEVLSNLGGLLCLFLGAGLISLMEIVYFFSLRPLVTLWNYFRQAKKQTLSIGQLWSYGATRLVHRH